MGSTSSADWRQYLPSTVGIPPKRSLRLPEDLTSLKHGVEPLIQYPKSICRRLLFFRNAKLPDYVLDVKWHEYQDLLRPVCAEVSRVQSDGHGTPTLSRSIRRDVVQVLIHQIETRIIDYLHTRISARPSHSLRDEAIHLYNDAIVMSECLHKLFTELSLHMWPSIRCSVLPTGLRRGRGIYYKDGMLCLGPDCCDSPYSDGSQVEQTTTKKSRPTEANSKESKQRVTNAPKQSDPADTLEQQQHTRSAFMKHTKTARRQARERWGRGSYEYKDKLGESKTPIKFTDLAILPKEVGQSESTSPTRSRTEHKFKRIVFS